MLSYFRLFKKYSKVKIVTQDEKYNTHPYFILFQICFMLYFIPINNLHKKRINNLAVNLIFFHADFLTEFEMKSRINGSQPRAGI